MGLVPCADRRDDTYVYYCPLGLTHTVVPVSDVRIVKEYGEVRDHRRPTDAECESVQAWELEFLQNYGPRPQPPAARLGWISPSGAFYPCAYTAHADLASQLAVLHGLSHYGGSECALERAGWLALKGNACLSRFDRLSADCVSTFRRVVEEFEFAEAANPDIDWNEELTANPEGYQLQFWATSPGEASYAKAMRQLFELYFSDIPDTPLGDLVHPPAYRIRRQGEHPGD